MPKPVFSALLAVALASPALADQFVLVPSGRSFEDTAFALEETIVGRGLVIDYTSHVGDMLERTRGDVGSDEVLFTNASIYLSCSAAVSRQVMEADWRNIAFCPHGVQVIERSGEAVMIGYLRRDVESMVPVNDLLAAIVAESTE